MNKNIIALAVAAAVLTVPVLASAQTTLYGQFKFELGYLDDGDDHNLAHSTKGTRLGVRGSEDLGGGMQAIYRFQGSFPRTNVPLQSQNYSMNEEAWVGLQGGFGRVLLGRSDTAVKLASSPFRPFSDTLADETTTPARWQRAQGIHYTTPNFGGVTLGATIEPTGQKTDAYYALNAIYKAGPLFVSAAYETMTDNTRTFTQAIQDESNWQLGASYNFGAGTVGLLYQDLDGDVNVWTLPVTYSVTPQIGLRAAVQYSDADDGDLTSIALGGQYHFSNRTELFANLWFDDFDITSDDDGTTFSTDFTNFGLGLRHSF